MVWIYKNFFSFINMYFPNIVESILKWNALRYTEESKPLAASKTDHEQQQKYDRQKT